MREPTEYPRARSFEPVEPGSHRRSSGLALALWPLAATALVLLLAACGGGQTAHQSTPVGSTPAGSPSPPPAAGEGGIFVGAGIPNQAVEEALIQLPFVAGFCVRTTWEDVEPKDGEFDWSYIDEQLALGQRDGKKVILRVMAGVYTPDWVYSKGAQDLAIPSNPRTEDKPIPRPARTPIPWDPVLLEEWGRFVDALGQRYDDHPSLYAVAMAGPTVLTSEMILPSYLPWEDAGYSEEKIVLAWKETIDAYGRAFQRTPFSLAVNPIPIPRHPGSVEPAKQVVTYGLARFGSRFFVQGNWLSDTFPSIKGGKEVKSGEPYAELYQLIADDSRSTTVGFQVGGHKLSGSTQEQELTTDVGRAVMRAVEAGASYVEVSGSHLADNEVQADLAKLAPSFQGKAQSRSAASS